MKGSSAEVRGPVRLADHLRGCVVGDRVILLDLLRSRYFALHGPKARVVARIIRAEALREEHEGMQAPRTEGRDPAASRADPSSNPASPWCRTPQAGALVEPLIRARILTTCPGRLAGLQGNAPLPPASLSAEEAAQSDSRSKTPGIPGALSAPGLQLPDLYQVAQAAGRAAFCLRVRSLGGVALSLQTRRQQLGIADGGDLHAVRHAVAVFDRLRPWFFTARDRCLFDSLALIFYLTSRRLPARWVIGVADRPFRAHAWVQAQELVLNDRHDHVRQFTPILVV